MTPVKRLEKINYQMGALAQELKLDLKLNPKCATQVGIVTAQICEIAAVITGMTREAQGKKGAKARIRTKVRTALGYLYP